ncbi:hypothetical protein DESAMIL20_619 [Desulfurella amilsii]|uniref:Uncharacterized protein n=1 Tax=Desulfurella amilsii TaxID=1562698 RepID=A0A1X4XYF8_9BACT|nr:DUF6506 family protein [Desulfurella amilsii]OSS42571.1 hypothetical protein DESAMIL20_619 [Desulfurella amilsii]
MALKAAFIFLAPGADPSKDKSIIKTQEVELHVVGCKNYKEACEVARQLLTDNIGAIELCGGFGNIGVAEVVKAVENKIPVGAIRFDIHPGLNNSSGDKIFI